MLVDVSDLESLLFHEVEEAVVFRPIDRAKNVFLALFRLDMELEASQLCAFSREIDVVDLVEANVHRRLVKIHEAALEWEKNAALRFVRAGHARERRIRLEVARNGDFSPCDGFHQTRDELVMRTLHVFLQLALESLLDFGFVKIEVDLFIFFLQEYFNQEAKYFNPCWESYQLIDRFNSALMVGQSEAKSAKRSFESKI